MGKVRELSDEERTALYSELLAKSENGKLPYGTLGQVATEYNVHRRTVSRIWKRAKCGATPTAALRAVKSMKKGRCGRPKKDEAAVIAALKSIPLTQRRTLRKAANATGVAKSTLWKVLKSQDKRLDAL